GTDANGCTNCSDSLAFSGVGLTETLNFPFSLYPNPNNGTFTIQPTDPLLVGVFDVMIADMTGRVIYEEKSAYGNKAIQLVHINSGAYHLIIHHNGLLSVSKLLVTK
ncbi:MAG: T9SS type A sorting domain-containing protein, partial [Bacteroidota bacterium]